MVTFKEILSETNGKMVYQEQLMKIGVDVLKMSNEESNHMRKAFGKKSPKIDKYRKIIIDKLGQKDGNELLSIIENQLEYAVKRNM